MSNILISKQNGIGVVLQNPNFSKNVDPTSGKSLNYPSCSDISDNLTTYVLKSTWVTALNNYLFPPYVECEYVV